MSSTDTIHELLHQLRRNPVPSHPVVGQLIQILESGTVVTRGGYVDRAVIAIGRPYTGVKRPPGVQKGRNKECFINAERLASNGHGIYVEGLAIAPNSPKPLHHAWITRDGSNAIEVTWTHQADACHYFGIPFPEKVLSRWITKLNYFGVLDCEPALQDELLADLKVTSAALHPLKASAP